MRFLLISIKNVFHNRVALLFSLIHWVIVVVIIAIKPPQQGLSYNFYEEPFYFQLLYISDLPAILTTALIFYPFYSQWPFSSWVFGSYCVFLIIMISIQWALIGLGVWKLWKYVTEKVIP